MTAITVLCVPPGAHRPGPGAPPGQRAAGAPAARSPGPSGRSLWAGYGEIVAQIGQD